MSGNKMVFNPALWIVVLMLGVGDSAKPAVHMVLTAEAEVQQHEVEQLSGQKAEELQQPETKVLTAEADVDEEGDKEADALHLTQKKKQNESSFISEWSNMTSEESGTMKMEEEVEDDVPPGARCCYKKSYENGGLTTYRVVWQYNRNGGTVSSCEKDPKTSSLDGSWSSFSSSNWGKVLTFGFASPDMGSSEYCTHPEKLSDSKSKYKMAGHPHMEMSGEPEADPPEARCCYCQNTASTDNYYRRAGDCEQCCRRAGGVNSADPTLHRKTKDDPHCP